MQKKLVLHVGTCKTGSTSIQNTLYKNRESIKPYIHYPGMKPINHSFNFVPMFLSNPMRSPAFRKGIGNTKPEDEIQRLKEEWKEEFQKNESEYFIVSAEIMTLPPFNDADIIRLKEFLADYFDEIIIVVYIRHYDRLVSSYVQQVIKNGFRWKSFNTIKDDLITGDQPDILYSVNINKWIKHFGRDAVRIRPFDAKEFYNNSLVDDFIKAFGLDPGKLDIEEIRSNTAIGLNSTRFIQEYNKSYPVFLKKKLNYSRGLASRQMPIHLFRTIEDEKFNPNITYNEQQAKILNDEIDYVNQFFENGYKFKHVLSEGESELVLDANDVPPKFYVDLFNNYNKQFDNLNNRIDRLIAKNKVNRNEKLEDFSESLFAAYKANSRKIGSTLKNIFVYLYYKIAGLDGFNRDYYSSKYTWSKKPFSDPLLHYILRGAYLCYNPSQNFHAKKYVMDNPDILINGDNPLIHYNRRDK